MGGWDQLRARIKGDGTNPMFFTFHTNRDLIRTLPALQHDPDRLEDCDSSGEDHAPDSARYAAMSRPYVAIPALPPKSDEYNVSIDPRTLRVSYSEGFSVRSGPRTGRARDGWKR